MPMDEDRARSRVRVPRGMADRAREFAAAGLAPAAPRDAATVILVRSGPVVDGVAGVEVFLLRRTKALEFAPGACVFPGGSVDERDADPAIAEEGWVGPAPADLGRLLGIPAERARALVRAAVRETFEESGVLLAGRSPTELVPDSAVLAEERHRLLDGSLSLGELLSRHRLAVRADLLTPWARWITPEISPRRFDTWFFAAALPEGQLAGLAAAGPGESDSGAWWQPSAALEAARAGEITLLPPTAVTLAELAAYQDIGGVLAEHRMITPLMPTVVVEDERAWLAMPQAVEYPL
jgi:8-oxo-dGTP pyrophosphatase MutT (NUDIX family)